MIRYGDEIRRNREAIGWTQGQLAAVTGYSERSIRDYESGRTTPDVFAFEVIVGAMGKRLEVVDRCT
ncbi:MAG: multiprotein-bridging factor 1 family protein [Phycisphaerae bacterium]